MHSSVSGIGLLCTEHYAAKTKAEAAARAKCKRLENERNGLPKMKAKARKTNWPKREFKSRNTFQERRT